MTRVEMIDAPPDWFKRSGLGEPGPGQHYLTTARYPLFYLQITKCGCTFLRNLVYYLDHDQVHPDSTRIHSHNDDFITAARIPRWFLKRSPYLFAVVRDPIDRFLSLYFDKIANLDNKYDSGMRDRLTKAANLVLTPEMSIQQHRENCLRLLAWFDLNLAGKTPGRPNAHWQRQSLRLSHTKGLNPRLLTLSGLSWQLPEILTPLIPDIQQKIDAVTIRNKSKRLLSRDEILTPDIERAVLLLYAEDAETYAHARDEWGPAPRTAFQPEV